MQRRGRVPFFVAMGFGHAAPVKAETLFLVLAALAALSTLYVAGRTPALE
jgi:hypothetical protein